MEQGQTISNRYKLLRQLGRGGFSEVWLVEDSLTGVQLALKIYAPGAGLDDAGVAMFTREFALVVDMNHTNLLRPTHFDCWERMPYLVMPLCRRGSAFQYLSGDARLSEEEAWRMLCDVAEGLAYLHGKTPPVIHQDIKPDNILISDEGAYMITDFGISSRIRSTLRKSGAMGSTGTLAYMGPERFSQSPAPIMASDVWSLGAMMFELLTGMPPFGEHGGLLQKGGADLPLLEADCSQELKDIIYRCLAPNTWDRPTARQVADYAHHRGEPVAQHEEPERECLVGEADMPADPVEPAPVSESENPGQPNGDREDRRERQPWWKQPKVMAAIVGAVVLVVVLCLLLGRFGKAPEPVEEVVVAAVDYDSICLSYIDEGRVNEDLGDAHRGSVDSLAYDPQQPEAVRVFEDFYLQALESYAYVTQSTWCDSVSYGVLAEAQNRLEQVETQLDSARVLLREKAELMRRFDITEAAEVFELRAEKVDAALEQLSYAAPDEEEPPTVEDNESENVW